MKSTSSLVMPMLPKTSAITGMQHLDLVVLVVAPDVVGLGERDDRHGPATGRDRAAERAHRYSL